MNADAERIIRLPGKRVMIAGFILVLLGAGAFIVRVLGPDPVRAWQAYLINFLFWSAVAQGALVFSAVMHVTQARWSGPLAGVAESFCAFFPISFLLFLGLLLGRSYVFPWMGEDLHGKENWLNLPFLFSRDAVGLLVLYGLGLAYVYQTLGGKLERIEGGGLKRRFLGLFSWPEADVDRRRKRMGLFGILYLLAFAVVLSLIGYDLVMALDPHWYSTLFGGYTFVKSFYVGMGGVIILAAALSWGKLESSVFDGRQFLDIGKLFLGFCLVWADFFYCQLVVIWYGNISEETSYVIERTMRAPYERLAWFVFSICFILPFLILINRKIKTRPKAMTVLCSVVLIGIWLEHLLLVGPVMSHGIETIPMGFWDVLMFVGFLGLMVLALAIFLKRFPEIITAAPAGGVKEAR